jgi:hypothetical protein
LFSDKETANDDDEFFDGIALWAMNSDREPFSGGKPFGKGSPETLAVFKAGTFLGSIQSTTDVEAQSHAVRTARQVIARALGPPILLSVNIGQGSRGSTDFILTVIGRSPQLDFPPGYWFD